MIRDLESPTSAVHSRSFDPVDPKYHSPPPMNCMRKLFKQLQQPITRGEVLCGMIISLMVVLWYTNLKLISPAAPSPQSNPLYSSFILSPTATGTGTPSSAQLTAIRMEASLERTRGWKLRPDYKPWWGADAYHTDAGRQATTYLNQFELSDYARTLPIQPAFKDCRYYYDRTPNVQLAFELTIKDAHHRIMTEKRLPDGSLSVWAQTYLDELNAALLIENDKYVPGIARWLTPELNRIQFKPEPVPLRCTDHAILLIEGRSDPNVIFIIRHTFFMLLSDTQRWSDMNETRHSRLSLLSLSVSSHDHLRCMCSFDLGCCMYIPPPYSRGLIIVHGPDNEESLIEDLEIWPGGAGEHVLLLGDLHPTNGRIDRSLGNKVIVSSALWESIPVENVLLIQVDAFMLKPPGADLPLWHQFTNQFVYVGAPFPHPSINPLPTMNPIWPPNEVTPFGGNGGLSFRKKSAMLHLLRQFVCDSNPIGDGSGVGDLSMVGECHWEDRFPWTTAVGERDESWAEDRWIARELYRRSYRYRSQIPFPELSKRFSVDTVHDDDPFFVHKYWQMFQAVPIMTKEKVQELLIGVKQYYQLNIPTHDQRTNQQNQHQETQPQPSPLIPEI